MGRKTELDKYITQVFSSLRHKSKRRGHPAPTFSKQELSDWLYANNLEVLYDNYINSGRDKNVKPSVDRIDDYQGYLFSNMQLITWRENHIKGVRSIKHRTSCVNSQFRKPVFIWNKRGDLIKSCEYSTEAAEFLRCHLGSITRAITGRRKTVKKHYVTNTPQFTH